MLPALNNLYADQNHARQALWCEKTQAQTRGPKKFQSKLRHIRMTYGSAVSRTASLPLLQGDGPQQPWPDTEAAARVPAGQTGGGPGGAATRLQLQPAVGECQTGSSRLCDGSGSSPRCTAGLGTSVVRLQSCCLINGFLTLGSFRSCWARSRDCFPQRAPHARLR